MLFPNVHGSVKRKTVELWFKADLGMDLVVYIISYQDIYTYLDIVHFLKFQLRNLL